MPSALETLVKILKLEQDTGYLNKAVIGGFQSFAARWATDAHAQAKKPEHHQLIDELVGLLEGYVELPAGDRHTAVKHMLGRITGRIPGQPGANHVATPAETASVPQEESAVTTNDAPPVPSTPSQPTSPASLNPPPDALEARPRRETERPEPRQAANVQETRGPREQRPAHEQREREQREKREPREQQGKRQQHEHREPRVSRVDADSFNAPDEDHPMQESLFSGDDFAPADVVPTPPEPPRLTKPPRRKRGPRDPQREQEALRALRQPVRNVNGIGPKIGEKLSALGLHTIESWLYFFPRRYDDYSRMLPIHKLKPGLTLTVAGTIRHAAVVKGRRGIEVFTLTVGDGTGTLTASFFGQAYLRNKLEPGLQIVLSGKTDTFNGRITMNNPEWELVERDALHTRGIIPVYALTKGLSAHAMRKLSYRVIERYAETVPDYMPEIVLERVDLADLGWSLRQIHFPESEDALRHAKRRLAFDEIMLLQLAVLRNRRDWQAVPGLSMQVSEEWVERFTSGLPYKLTGAQRRAIEAIRADMAQPIPMNRLLQGDVGAGKTVVAAITMAMAVANGSQAAIMAPTSILAEQHYKGISRLLASVPGGDQINVKLLTGSTSTQERNDILWGLGEGSVHILIGTHALIQEGVNFARLGVVVIDEQHRFGVEQRAALRGKGAANNPHVLVMTATPIPRTLALTVYADLDLTVLDEMPPGRTPVDTKVLYPKERERAYGFIDSQVRKGRQAFIVYPLVEASESDTMSEVRAAVQEFDRLQAEIFPDFKLGLLHGRLSPQQKDAVMAAFGRGELDILVSTSVVEVGIDVPNASTILIEGANRFGLAQLHQFRGRVGRGSHQSFCLLLPDDGDVENPRLKAMEATTDGFALAEMDWKLRGAGDLLGTQQSGGAQLAAGWDSALVSEAQIEARTIYEDDPTLSAPEHSGLHERINTQFGVRDAADVS